MRYDRRRWLTRIGSAAAALMVGRPRLTVAAPLPARPQPSAPLLPPAIARIADLKIEERIEPALVFVPRQR